MTTPSNVLVTCGGKWVGAVLQLKRAMRQVEPLARGRIFVADRAKVTPAGCFADESFVVPPIASPDYIDRLVDLCGERGVRVVVPLMDIDLLRLAPHGDRFAAVGTTLACPSTELTEMCFDKLEFEAFALAAQIPLPRRFEVDQIEAASFPLFAKPQRGFGSLGSGVCCSVGEAKRMLSRNPDTIFQEYIDAPEISVDAFISSSGDCTVCVGRIRDQVVGGEVARSHTVKLPKVRAVALHAIDALARRGLRGPLNLQVFHAEQPLVIEVNPRLGSGHVLSNMASHGRLDRSLLAESCGIVCDGDPDDYDDGLYLHRYHGDIFHNESEALAVFPGGDEQ